MHEERLRWDVAGGLPEDNLSLLTAQEQQYAQAHNRLLHEYQANYNLDLTRDCAPPVDHLNIKVHVLQDIGKFIGPESGATLELKRGDVHLGRGDAVEEWKAFVSAEEARAPFRAAELLWPSGASESVPASINASKSAEALTLAPPGPAAPASIGELTGFPARILYLSDYLLVVAPDGVEGGAPLAMDVWLRSAIDN